MTKNSLTKSLLISVVIGIGFSIYHETKTVATTLKPAKTSPEILVQNTENQNLVRETKQHNTVNNKNNGIKSASQQLVGGWTATAVSDSGKKIKDTILYDPDGTYSHIITINDQDWYIYNRGSWQISEGILYETLESGERLEGSIKFISNNEFIYQSANGTTKWTRINSKPNLSAEQLLGTWSIREKTNSFDFDQSSTLIELNSNGTFRYEKTELIPGSLSWRESKASGTWEYVNAGYADGLLLLRNSQGQLVSIGSVNWTSNGNFLHINRSQYDPSKNKYNAGRLEEFRRTDSRID